jgi:hypothetical protein
VRALLPRLLTFIFSDVDIDMNNGGMIKLTLFRMASVKRLMPISSH